MDVREENNVKRLFNDEEFKPDELIRSYYHRFSNYGEIPMHYHSFHELNVIINGSGKHFIGEKAFDISRGSIFIIPPFVNHGYSFDSNDFVVYHILFRSKFFDKYEQILDYVPGYNIFFDIEPYLRLKTSVNELLLHLDDEKFAELSPSFALLDEYENKVGTSQQKKEFLALFIIASVCENVDYESNKTREGDYGIFYIMKSTEYLQNNYDKKITTNELCEKSNMSRSTFLRNFKKYYGVTPSEYLNEYRIKQAKAMLTETDKSITTIAHDCGFFDSSHFIRIFRNKLGVSPLSFRKSAPPETE